MDVSKAFYLLYIDPDEPDEVVMLAEPVMFPPVVAFVPPVILVSGVLMFCAFAEFRPMTANMPIIAAIIGMIKTNCFLIDFHSVLLTYKGLEVIISIHYIKYQMP